MKFVMIFLGMSLTGCASNVALKDTSDATQAIGTLHLGWLQPSSLEVTLDGQRYVGEWSRERCFHAECRGVYGNLPKVHRRHILKGHATLKSTGGNNLECEWVSHLPDVRGACRAQDGRQFKLQEG